MSTTTTESGTRSRRRDVAMELRLTITVPTSADQEKVLSHLLLAANHRQGVTITMPRGDQVDVDLIAVREVSP